MVIYYVNTNSLNALPRFVAVAIDKPAAERWIQDEVDGKHEDSHMRYMTGKTASWWLEHGSFRLKETPLQK